MCEQVELEGGRFGYRMPPEIEQMFRDLADGLAEQQAVSAHLFKGVRLILEAMQEVDGILIRNLPAETRPDWAHALLTDIGGLLAVARASGYLAEINGSAGYVQ